MLRDGVEDFVADNVLGCGQRPVEAAWIEELPVSHLLPIPKCIGPTFGVIWDAGPAGGAVDGGNQGGAPVVDAITTQGLAKEIQNYRRVGVGSHRCLRKRRRIVSIQTTLTAIRGTLTTSIIAAGSQAEEVRKGITEVSTRLGDAAMRQAVMGLGDILRKLAEEIALLRAYKSLHDCLHNLQMQLRGLAIQAILKQHLIKLRMPVLHDSV